MVMAVFLLLVGFLLLVKGADVFVDGASSIAKIMGIPELVIGLTIVAMGTSLPEAAVSISSAWKGSAGICIGNVVGSNILNILIVLGITGLFKNLPLQVSTLKYEIPFMVLVTVVMYGCGLDGRVGLYEGLILWGFFLVYLAYLYMLTRKGNAEEAEEDQSQMPLWKAMLLVVIGAVMVVVGSDFAVDGATGLAKIFGVSDRIIGLTIVALGTSLPELITSVTAARKGNTDLAIGNIVGSNIFNILFVLGTTALILPVPFEANFLADTLVALGAAAFLWIGSVRKQELRKTGAVIMLLFYVAYLTWMIL